MKRKNNHKNESKFPHLNLQSKNQSRTNQKLTQLIEEQKRQQKVVNQVQKTRLRRNHQGPKPKQNAEQV